MDAGRLAIGCAVVALLAGHALSRLTPAERTSMLSGAGMLRGDAPTAERAAVPRPPLPRVAAPAAVAVPASGMAETLAPDPHGQFQAEIEIDGDRLKMLVDTGASSVALSLEDAERLGIRPLPADFRIPVMTANGRAFAAPVRLGTVRLGSIVLRDVEALVSGPGALGQSLLGMSFLSRLSAVRMEHGRLALEP